MPLFDSPLVSAAWLAENHKSVRIVDVRWSIPTGPKHDSYLEKHIAGAVFADLDNDLSAPAGAGGRHPLPSPVAFAETRRRLGLDRPVVAYDDNRGAVAARLWWMLDAIGADVAILEGGITAWTGPVENDVPTIEPVAIDPIPWPSDRFVDAADISSLLAKGVPLIDARSAERFAGHPNPIDERPGHIPGSRSRPWQCNLDDDDRFLPSDQLERHFSELGITGEVDFVASCGSGVTGCHNLLAARLAGIKSGRLYTGSWSEWSQDTERPIATHK